MTIRHVALFLLVGLAACAPGRPLPASTPVVEGPSTSPQALETHPPVAASSPSAVVWTSTPEGLASTATATKAPGVPQMQTLQNAELGYRLVYDPQAFVPELPGWLPNEVDGLRLLTPLGDTLESAYLLVTLEPTTNWHQCLDTPPAGEGGAMESRALGTLQVNGEGYQGYEVTVPVFVDSTFFERQYRGYHMPTSRCVTVHLVLHAERPADRVREEEKQAVWARLMEVFGTMTWMP